MLDLANESLVIHNIVTTADLEQYVDVRQFNEFPWGRYDLEANYNGKVGYIKHDSFSGRVTIFMSGKMISTGAKTPLHSIDQLEKSMNLLVRNHFTKRKKLYPTIQNIVATLDLGYQIDFRLAATQITKCVYEPDQFPGIIHKSEYGISSLIFQSGKVIIAGAKSEEKLFLHAEAISDLLSRFKA